MLNSFKSPQRIALIGGTSEIGNAVIAALPQAAITEVIRVSRSTTNFDASDRGEREALIHTLFKQDLDLAVIAIGALGNDVEMSKEDNLLNIIEINYSATAHLLFLLAEEMKVQGHGQILIISSFAQERPRVDNFAYGSTKAGIDFYSRGLADSLIGTGVEVKILRPGFVRTKMTSGMKSAPFSIFPERAGQAGAKLLQSDERIAYAPEFLKIVAWIFRKMPRKVFLRVNKS